MRLPDKYLVPLKYFPVRVFSPLGRLQLKAQEFLKALAIAMHRWNVTVEGTDVRT